MVPSGYKSSEFITTLSAMITYILVATGVIPSDKLGDMGDMVTKGITGIVAIVALVSYMLSRTEVKKSAIEAQKTLG